MGMKDPINVLADRKKYVDQLHEYNYPEPDERPIIRIYHDESTFYANLEEKFFWADGSNVPIRSKSLGQAIMAMVSDFIEGYLENGNDKARVYLEHSKEGYWNNERLLKQVDKAMDIFEAKYPDACGLFLFDKCSITSKGGKQRTQCPCNECQLRWISASNARHRMERQHSKDGQ